MTLFQIGILWSIIDTSLSMQPLPQEFRMYLVSDREHILLRDDHVKNDVNDIDTPDSNKVN
jgi:hypothetical protein